MIEKLQEIILIMGVSGCGKTTVGKLLAERLDAKFIDADSFHPASNINKMSRYEPLDDSDRWPWLDSVSDAIHMKTKLSYTVLACSALKQNYRARLKIGKNPIIFLTGPRKTIESRLASRQKHFMPNQLLESQIADLEPPKNAIQVSIIDTPMEIVTHIINSLSLEK
jgi:carbohydrate kinase (thermoresistant glucokinase family)